MSRIVILGAGVMGSALAVPPASLSGNQVLLIGSPLDDDIIDSVNRDRHHPTLDVSLPATIEALRNDQLDDDALRQADNIVIGVSSAGVGWATQRIANAGAVPVTLALVTKGLVADPEGDAPPITYADALPAELCSTANGIVGIGGPCIARELALGYPTRVTFASRHRANAERMRADFQNDHYRITLDSDIVGVEACAALKNFLCIGVSAMFTAHPLDDQHAKNPLAALFNQAVVELATLAEWLREASRACGQREGVTDAAAPDHVPGNEPGHEPGHRPGHAFGQAAGAAFDLAGMGDLHVTVGGGRNSLLGRHLGEGKTLSATMAGPLQGVTVEGVDTGRALARGFQSACRVGRLDASELPLTTAILDVIEHDVPFTMDFRTLPG